MTGQIGFAICEISLSKNKDQAVSVAVTTWWWVELLPPLSHTVMESPLSAPHSGSQALSGGSDVTDRSWQLKLLLALQFPSLSGMSSLSITIHLLSDHSF